MKRQLTYDEIRDIIKEEDRCGVNTLLQEVFACTDGNSVKLGWDCNVIAEFNHYGDLEKYEVIMRNKNENLS